VDYAGYYEKRQSGEGPVENHGKPLPGGQRSEQKA